ncbi:TonB-dependent receptor [Sphingomonas sp.]|uniref:TonB-dependent receptor n=1 Tax=Sphingomonas sp. TaxID=28214 RepID=UPI002EDA5383
MRKFQLLTASAIALMATTPAFAQDAAQPAEQAPVEDAGEVVVTATGRAQLAQDVPIAVSVVGAEAIENAGVSDIRGLRQVTPSLQVTTGQSAATGVVLRIRGIGTAGDNPGFEPAVGVFIDGVFRARAGVALSDLPPIDRVEVLRGPQGTLFGRNTSAGALSITTQGPSFDLGGYVEAAYGNYDEIEVKAGLTGGVTEQLALRVDGGYHKRDGYIIDPNTGRDFNNIDRYFVRGQAKFETTDITFRLIGDYAETDEACCGAINTGSGFVLPVLNPDGTRNINNTLGLITSSLIEALSANPLAGGAVGRDGIVRPFDREGRRMATSPNRDLTEKVKEWGVSGQLDWNLGDVTLTSITAYRDWKATRSQDIDFSGLDRAYRDGYKTGIQDFTQEIRLKGSAFDGKLDWLVGGFYLNEKLTLTDVVRFGTQTDQFVDGLVNQLSRSAALPTGGQLFGTLGAGVPLMGQVAFATASPAVQAAILASPAIQATFFQPIPRTPNGAGQQADNYQVDTQAFAIFTHNIINITDNVSLTLGLRWNHETKDISANLNASVPACSFWLNPNAGLFRQELNRLGLYSLAHLYTCNPTINSEFNGNYNGDRSESEFTGTAKLAFKLSDNVLLYGGYDRGYKSGGYNLDRGSFDSVLLGGNGAQISDLEFGNETVDAFEVGFKTNPIRGFQFNVAGFYQEFKGYQNNAFEGTRFVTRNFAKVISKGIEVESVIRPASNLTVALNYTLLDTEVKDPLAGADNGQPLTNSPRNVITGAITWTPQISENVGALFHVDWRTNSDAHTINNPVAIPFTTNDGYSIVNARVGLNFGENSQFGIEAYVENLFDTYYSITAFPIPEQGSSFAVYPAPPRFYGVKARVKF